MPQIKHFEKLSFRSGGHLYRGDIQNFGEGGRALYEGLGILWGDLIAPKKP